MSTIIHCVKDSQCLPEKKTQGAICRDLRLTEEVTIAPGELKTAWTWLKTFIPNGRQCKMYARSWLPVKHGVTLANWVAVFDSDYRGEYIVQLLNISQETVTLTKYMRVAQIDFLPAYQPEHPRFWTPDVPTLETIVDEEVYNTFEEKYPSARWDWRFNSTWTH